MSNATICYGIKYPLSFEFIWEKGVDWNLFDPEDCFEEWWKRIFPFTNRYIGIVQYGFSDYESEEGSIICLEQSKRIIDMYEPYRFSNQLFLSKYDDISLINFCKKYTPPQIKDLEENIDFFIPHWYISIYED